MRSIFNFQFSIFNKFSTLKFSLLFSLFSLLYFFFPASTFAQGIGLNITKQGTNRGIPIDTNALTDPKNTLLGIVFKNIIVLLFTVGALAFIIMFVWGTVDWILSGGDKEKIAGARKRIVTAITGLVLLSLTFVIMVVLGQVLGIGSLARFDFPIPKLTDK